MPATQTRDGSNFRKAAATFQPGAETLPQRYFVSPEIFAEELQKISSSNWVLVGHQSQLAKPGDYFLAEIANESLVVTKDHFEAVASEVLRDAKGFGHNTFKITLARRAIVRALQHAAVMGRKA